MGKRGLYALLCPLAQLFIIRWQGEGAILFFVAVEGVKLKYICVSWSEERQREGVTQVKLQSLVLYQAWVSCKEGVTCFSNLSPAVLHVDVFHNGLMSCAK